jgi:hypothetical protein
VEALQVGLGFLDLGVGGPARGTFAREFLAEGGQAFQDFGVLGVAGGVELRHATMRRMHALTIAGPREVTVDVPVQYFQSVIALETAITGVLLFQIRFFATSKDTPQEPGADPRLRVLLLVVLAATIFGSLEAIREGWGQWSAVLVTVGLAVSALPILLRVLPPLQRDARTRQRDPHYWVTVIGLLLYAVVVLLIVGHP